MTTGGEVQVHYGLIDLCFGVLTHCVNSAKNSLLRTDVHILQYIWLAYMAYSF